MTSIVRMHTSLAAKERWVSRFGTRLKYRIVGTYLVQIYRRVGATGTADWDHTSTAECRVLAKLVLYSKKANSQTDRSRSFYCDEYS